MPDTDLAIDLVHEDAHLLVLNKPAGLLCVPGRGEDKQDCLSARAMRRWPDALIVHRLDMATSGLVLMARGAAMQRALGDAFANRVMHKRYEAIVDGAMPVRDEWSVIDAPLMADWPRRPLQKVDPAGKPSVTRWRALSSTINEKTAATHVLLEPLTGRSHQLRVHLLSIGHPILGDALYGSAEVQARAPRLLLHASELGFVHPATQQMLRFQSQPDFAPLLPSFSSLFFTARP
ncbi:RluA family pseudouridine synthase [Variovorax sp. CCNWLW186]|uniref:RluA family pseudouridine synthase n=1 Tax=Variovorax sp. CCNWLW186 TaxID=3127473 RepID=UPI0030787267